MQNGDKSRKTIADLIKDTPNTKELLILAARLMMGMNQEQRQQAKKNSQQGKSGSRKLG